MPRAFVMIGLAAVILGSSTCARGDDAKAAEAVLTDKGLRRLGTTYVVAGEAEVQKKLTEARGVFRELVNGQAQQQGLEYQAQERKQMIRGLTEQRIMLNQQLAQQLPASEHNQLIAVANTVTDRLNLLRQQEADPDAKKDLDAAVARRREAYIQSVLDLRVLVDATNTAYTALADDAEVKAALVEAARKAKAKTALGPSRGYLANVKLLENAEKSVLTEDVPLRKEGGIFWLDVTFNGKITKAMAFDTGASSVVLPAEFAAEIGLKPGADAPVVQCQVADGSVVEAREMAIPVMRVGKFTVKDVRCVIMPASKKDVPPLLGQTFQRNFTFQFSADTGKLTLSRVEAPESARPATKPSAKPSTKSSASKR
jgi:clan AA aspartic protease (TIGR02281 family)